MLNLRYRIVVQNLVDHSIFKNGIYNTNVSFLHISATTIFSISPAYKTRHIPSFCMQQIKHIRCDCDTTLVRLRPLESAESPPPPPPVAGPKSSCRFRIRPMENINISVHKMLASIEHLLNANVIFCKKFT